jgi:hypothetical protein
LANTTYVQAVLGDSSASTADVQVARASVTVTGATSSAGINQKFLTLPALDEFVRLKEEIYTATAGGQSFTLLLDTDVVLLDGMNGVPTLNIGNPALFKSKAYRIVCVNNTFPPVISFDTNWPSATGALTFTMSAIGSVATLFPTSRGTWAISIS